MSANETFVIVGAGLAGAKAAETLRHEGFDGRLVLIGSETERPYERPPLSKDFLRGESTDTPYVHPADYYEARNIELMTGSNVGSIDAKGQEIALEEGGSVGYDRLLLATGAEPRRLDVRGADLDGIFYLRTVSNSKQLGARLEPERRVVVVGAGWIGAEIAASARQKGCEVTMLEMGALPLERVLGRELGQIYLDLHRDHGVEFLPKTIVGGFEGGDKVERVVTMGGAAIDADLVMIGIGVAPRTKLAEDAGLEVSNGIVADENLETSIDGIFAAGDVANAYHPSYGRQIRVEHWANAQNQGQVAARAMLGERPNYDEIPYFFSDQYDAGMEYSGYAPEWDEVVFRGDVGSREFIAFWLKDGRVVAGMNMNIWDVNDEIRELILAGNPIAGRGLEDRDIPLAQLVDRGAGHASTSEAGSR
ncbi:MAG TPA: FAD-dependent oxidoreductase [Solirubrobacterales bacterium]|nr:FAD-dependent oxidoreductase [Solirubrobacterales bacterium]